MLSRCLYLHNTYTLTHPRIKEKLRSGEMAVSGDQWPTFLYHGYNYDSDDPWNGLFRSILLVSVRSRASQTSPIMIKEIIAGIQAYIYITKLRRERA
jgi:hypothetical protein